MDDEHDLAGNLRSLLMQAKEEFTEPIETQPSSSLWISPFNPLQAMELFNQIKELLQTRKHTSGPLVSSHIEQLEIQLIGLLQTLMAQLETQLTSAQRISEHTNGPLESLQLADLERRLKIAQNLHHKLEAKLRAFRRASQAHAEAEKRKLKAYRLDRLKQDEYKRTTFARATICASLRSIFIEKIKTKRRTYRRKVKNQTWTMKDLELIKVPKQHRAYTLVMLSMEKKCTEEYLFYRPEDLGDREELFWTDSIKQGEVANWVVGPKLIYDMGKLEYEWWRDMFSWVYGKDLEVTKDEYRAYLLQERYSLKQLWWIDPLYFCGESGDSTPTTS